MIVASFVSHRSYTQLLLGIVYFGIIAAKLETSLELNGVFYACLAGYVSHLIFDMKVFPSTNAASNSTFLQKKFNKGERIPFYKKPLL